MRVLWSIAWACVSAAALAAAEDTDANLAKPGIAAWSNESSSRTAVAPPPAVEQLAAALINITRPTSMQLRLQHNPGRLMVKFKELYGNNYSAVAQLVNDWAGIDLAKVREGHHMYGVLCPSASNHRGLRHDAVGMKPHGVPSCCTAPAGFPVSRSGNILMRGSGMLAGPARNRDSSCKCEQQPLR